jgi:hypothetical protein
MAGTDVPDTVEGRSVMELARGEDTDWRQYIHIEHAPVHHSLTDGKEKYIWFVEDGSEQFFRLTDDPDECRDLAGDPVESDRISCWRNLLIDELKDRPEGFTEGTRLIPGRTYKPVLSD